MRFSAFVVSLLAANVSAKRWGCGNKSSTIKESVTVDSFTAAGVETAAAETPAYTPGAHTPGAHTPGAHTPGFFTPDAAFTPGFFTPGSYSWGVHRPTDTETSAIPAPTTLVTRKITASASVSTSTSVEAAETYVAPTTSAKATTSEKAASSAAAAATSTTSASSSTSTLTTDEQNALDAHNAARSAVGVADLTWDDDLAADAQTWATHLASIDSLTHSSVEDQGENLYEQYSTDAALTNAVAAFVEEKSSYNGEAITDTNYLTFGHYTQVVWSDTTKLGMALATSSSGATYVVARYYTPGNYIGETPY